MINSFQRTSGFNLFLILMTAGLISCASEAQQKSATIKPNNEMAEEPSTQSQFKNMDNMNIDTATFGAGCFWCVEAIFQDLEGVNAVAAGYAGGHIENPSYKAVCEGTTGHAEVCQITYDPEKITFEELLEVFWQTHDPTTANRQGNDVGPQYRSVVFYHNDSQKDIAEKFKIRLNEARVFSNPIVTEITKINNYFTAENYHQDYFSQNPEQSYCSFVISPKVEKFRKVFKDKLKKE
jgi:peptide-methionine (S)-S-oxide reductase